MDPREYIFVKHKVLKLTGIDLSCYKTPQVQRRLRTYLLRSGHPNWHHFFRAVSDDPTAVGRLKDYLTINVSSFFRDREKFEYLQHTILPNLIHDRPRLRVWSAGCSHGHEPYSLAIMLAEATGLHRRHQILATDIDHSALARAQAGGPYSLEETKQLASPLLERYFKRTLGDDPDEEYFVIEHLRRRVTFDYLNLLIDPFGSDFDLIVCRNVVIYFTTEVKDHLYGRFHEALRPGGVLFVGGTEIVPQAAKLGFEPVGISFYRRRDERAQPLRR
jgi:chemotaxis protein methyltransferase CheR